MLLCLSLACVQTVGMWEKENVLQKHGPVVVEVFLNEKRPGCAAAGLCSAQLSFVQLHPQAGTQPWQHPGDLSLPFLCFPSFSLQ